MIAGLFALIIIFGIVGALAFLHESKPALQEDCSLKAADFDIHESTE